MKKNWKKKEEIAEDVCFICKDGGVLLVCDYKFCLKAYHTQCVDKEPTFLESEERWTCSRHSCFICHKSSKYHCVCCPNSVCRACAGAAEFVHIKKKGFCNHCLKLVLLIEENRDIDSDGVRFQLALTCDANSIGYREIWSCPGQRDQFKIKNGQVWTRKFETNPEGTIYSIDDVIYDDVAVTMVSSKARLGEKMVATKPIGEFQILDSILTWFRTIVTRNEKRIQDKVDFNDTETYEFLFKDYWEEIKEKEKLTLQDLQTADSLLKKGEFTKGESDSDKLPEDEGELISDVDDMESVIGEEMPKVEKAKGKCSIKKLKSGGKKFDGWGSKELIGFLKSIGKDTERPLTQMEVHDIVREYIQENNLVNPRKKKRVLCDARLHSLFGRKKLNRLRIYDLLETHLATNQKSDDELLYSSTDEEVPKVCKRRRSSGSYIENPKSKSTVNIKGKVVEAPESIYACVTMKNIKLVYLRRSLIMEFLKVPETFDNKVMDCFVKVRCEDQSKLSRNFYQLVQVTGIKKASQAYKTGETSTDFVLQVSNMEKDILICMVSDDEFSNEECEELHQRVKKGLVKRPIVAELLEKAKALHEDITNHRIEKEIMMLQNLIARANEKGWRRELMEYVEKLQLLRSPEERLRQLQQFPSIVADAEAEFLVADQNDGEGEIEGNGTASKISGVSEEEKQKQTTDTKENTPGKQVCYFDQGDENSSPQAGKLMPESEKNQNSKPENNPQAHISEDKQVDPITEKQKLWHYLDPMDVVQGPFSMSMLRRWHEEDYFPEDFKVWRADQAQEQAVLLTDLLSQKVVGT